MKQPTQYHSLPLSVGNNVLGELKEFLPQIFTWGGVREGGREDGLLCFWSKNKKDCKIKYSSEDTISNTALGLLQLPNNQLMFSFVILSFC